MGPMLILPRPPAWPQQSLSICLAKVHLVLQVCPQEQPAFLRGPDRDTGPALGGTGETPGLCLGRRLHRRLEPPGGCVQAQRVEPTASLLPCAPVTTCPAPDPHLTFPGLSHRPWKISVL